MLTRGRARQFLAFLVLAVLLTSFSACQAGPVVAPTPTRPPSPAPLQPTATPQPSATPAPPPGAFWVDPTRELGEISRLVLGANHGPWSDLGIGNIEPAKSSGITFLRWPGGSWGDNNDIQTYFIDNFINETHFMNAVPSITVRLPNSTPEKAAALVKYVNIDKKLGVKYWAIGNEPSLYENDTNLKKLNLNAVTYAQRWREFAKAMKAVDPTITLFGPDTHQYKGDPSFDPKDNEGRDYLREFLKLNGDLVDIVTVHRYPFPSCQTCNNPTAAELFANTPEWDHIITNLKAETEEITGKNLPVGVTEYNSSYTRVVSTDTSPDSFNGAIWLADVLGRMIRQQPEMLAYWILKDTAGHGLLAPYDIRPSYYVFQIYKRFGNHLLSASSGEPMVSVFAAGTDDGSVTVIFVNRGEAAVKKPLQLKKGDALRLSEVVLFDKDHKADAVTPPAFQNGDPVELAGRTVTLFIFKP